MKRSAHIKGIAERLSSELRGDGRKVMVSAPGRVDFLNTHQDYKGLPVVPVAIGLRCYAMGKKTKADLVRVASLNLAEAKEPFSDEFRLSDIRLRGHGWFGDYVRAIFKSLGGVGRAAGMDIALWSDIPIGSGLSSSAALEVSIAKLHSACLGYKGSPRALAESAYKAEHDIMGIPCGRLDQYSSSFGGVMSLQTRPPFRVEQLDWPDLTFVVADSGEHHRTAAIHPVRQKEIEEGLRILMDEARIPKGLARKLGYRCSDPSWEDINEAEISPFLPTMKKAIADRLLFTLRMQVSTSYALAILRRRPRVPAVPPSLATILRSRGNDALSALGAVMDYQHELLRDLYEVSTPRLEELRETLVDSGALGAKISGAGLGGAVIGLVRDRKAGLAVKKACEGSGIEKVWVTSPGEGARVEDPNRPATEG